MRTWCESGCIAETEADGGHGACRSRPSCQRAGVPTSRSRLLPVAAVAVRPGHPGSVRVLPRRSGGQSRQQARWRRHGHGKGRRSCGSSAASLGGRSCSRCGRYSSVFLAFPSTAPTGIADITLKLLPRAVPADFDDPGRLRPDLLRGGAARSGATQHRARPAPAHRRAVVARDRADHHRLVDPLLRRRARGLLAGGGFRARPPGLCGGRNRTCGTHILVATPCRAQCADGHWRGRKG